MRVTLEPSAILASQSSVARSRIFIVCAVLLLHGLALWALQVGLLQRMVDTVQEVVTPIAVLPGSRQPAPPPVAKPAAPDKNTPLPKPDLPQVMLSPAPLVATPVAPPAPMAIADATPAPNAPAGQTTAHPVAALAPPPPPAPAAPAKIEYPSSDANYLHNPEPLYPLASERRREYGLVLLAVVVDADGRAKSVSIKTSSGYERLDQSALKAVSAWTFVPGKRNGVPVEMTVEVPIRFKPRE